MPQEILLYVKYSDYQFSSSIEGELRTKIFKNLYEKFQTKQYNELNPHVPIIQLQQLMFCHFLFQQDFYHLPTPTRFCFSEKVLLHTRAGAQSCLAAAFLWLQGHCAAPLCTEVCPHRFLVGLQGLLVRRDPEQLPIGGRAAQEPLGSRLACTWCSVRLRPGSVVFLVTCTLAEATALGSTEPRPLLLSGCCC